MKQFMDDEMAEYAVTEADGALECIFAEKVKSHFTHCTLHTLSHFKLKMAEECIELVGEMLF